MNQKLINDLREGRIVLHNEPKNPEAVKEILNEAWPEEYTPNGDCKYYWKSKISSRKWSASMYEEDDIATIIPIADFLRPEPMFKVGDLVQYKYYDKEIFRIEKADWSEKDNTYFYSEKPDIRYSESSIDFAPAQAYTEQQFEIGKEYEFRDSENDKWTKANLLGIVDFDYKYVVIRNGCSIPEVYRRIRPIQPRKITRYINIRPDGRVLRKSYETEQEARDKAYQGGMTDCKQVKLEGVIDLM